LISFAAMALLGFLLGMRHALDPDHVIAVTTIVSTQRSVAKAGLIGTMWGIGHTVTILAVGSAIILFNLAIPPRLGLSMELAVGGMLILLGLLTLTGTTTRLQQRFGAHAAHVDLWRRDREHGEHASPSDDKTGHRSVIERVLRGLGLYNMLRPLIVGIVHGLAGSAAVALLVMTTIHDPWLSVAYLLLFGLGTIGGMVLITAVTSIPFIKTADRFSGLNRGIRVASGLISLGFGLFLAYEIGIVQGLFTKHPQWVPR
jgi:high-affinity nickel permease